jgi:hypothetical protein
MKKLLILIFLLFSPHLYAWTSWEYRDQGFRQEWVSYNGDYTFTLQQYSWGAQSANYSSSGGGYILTASSPSEMAAWSGYDLSGLPSFPLQFSSWSLPPSMLGASALGTGFDATFSDVKSMFDFIFLSGIILAAIGLLTLAVSRGKGVIT